jgi:uncharacterized membrane protein YphA (DoxX/SURF4 family)
MNSKTANILYWIITILFSAAVLMDATGGLVMAKDGIEAFNQLGYPVYLLRFFGVLKILGVAAILVPGFPRIREWAFAGFAFNFIGALYSWAAVGNGTYVVFPIIMLGILAIIYFMGKRTGHQPAIAR